MNSIEHLQSNEVKQEVRNLVYDAIAKSKEQLGKLSYIGLPATQWIIENQLLADYPKTKIIGVEGGTYTNGPKMGKKVYPDMKANAPKKAKAIQGRFDEVLASINPNKINLVVADYCGNPAEFCGGRYSYPHLQAFVDFVKKTTIPSIYYMTFSCNGRLKGGKDPLAITMGGKNVSGLPQAVLNKISVLLSGAKLSHKVTKILSVYYHGGERSLMLTIGFAINFKPSFSPVKLDWIGNGKKPQASSPKIVKENKSKGIDLKSERSRLIRLMADNGFNNMSISQLLNLSRNQVGSVMAHKNHGDSWKRTEKKVKNNA